MRLIDAPGALGAAGLETGAVVLDLAEILPALVHVPAGLGYRRERGLHLGHGVETDAFGEGAGEVSFRSAGDDAALVDSLNLSLFLVHVPPGLLHLRAGCPLHLIIHGLALDLLRDLEVEAVGELVAAVGGLLASPLRLEGRGAAEDGDGEGDEEVGHGADHGWRLRLTLCDSWTGKSGRRAGWGRHGKK